MGGHHFFSSHFPCCTPTHWYILLLAYWASSGLLWPIHSLSLAYLFSPRLGTYPCVLCIYWLDLWVLWALCHCSCVLSLVIHGFFFRPLCIFMKVCLWVLLLSPRLYLLLFSLMLWWQVLVLELQVKLVTPFISLVGFDPRFIGWGGTIWDERFEVLLVGLC